MTVMEQAVEHSADGCGVAQEFAPVVYGAIGSHQGGGAFIAAHNDLQQILGSSEWELAHAQVIEDKQGHGGQELHVLLPGVIEG